MRCAAVKRLTRQGQRIRFQRGREFLSFKSFSKEREKNGPRGQTIDKKEATGRKGTRQ